MLLLRALLLISLHIFVNRVETLRSDCFLRVSEVHGDLTKKEALDEAFVEVQGICATGSAGRMGLVNHKIAVIKAFGQGDSNGAQIIGVINLQNEHLNDAGFFTVGGSKVEGKSIDWKNTNVKLKPLLLGSAASLFGKSKEDHAPYAIAILEGPSANVRLDEKGIVHITVDPKIESTIKNALVDMVVYGRSTLANKCNVYDRISPALASQGKYILREYNFIKPRTTVSSKPTSAGQSTSKGSQVLHSPTIEVERFSLSRCAITNDPFVPKTFKLARVTPNAPNDCEHGVAFIMENYAAELFAVNVLEDTETEKACQTDILGGLVDKNINTHVSYSDHTRNVPTLLPVNEQGDIAEAMTSASDRLLSIMPPSSGGVSKDIACSANRNTLWDEMIKRMAAHQKGVMPITWLKTNKAKVIDWLEYLYDETNPSTSTLRCSICHKNVGVKNPLLSQRYLPDLAKTEGVLKTSEKSMRECLHDHLHNSKWHLALIADKNEAKNEAIDKSIDKLQILSIQNLNSLQKSTAFMMHTIYTEARMYLPFESHPILMQALKLRGVDAGVHHQHAKAPPMFLRVISEDMHRRLLNHLTTNQHPVSLILDTATDSIGHDILVLLLQGLELDKPVVYLYRIMRMGADVSAEGFLRVIMAAFKSEQTNYNIDFVEYLKKNLVGFTSDGVSVFSGRVGGLGVLLSKELFGDEKKLFRQHCYAHKLNLVGRHLVEKIDHLQKMENDIKAISIFYNAQNHKNLAHLTELASVRQQTLYRLTYTFTERWATNELLVLERLKKMLQLLNIDLEAISQDTKFTSDARSKATGLRSIITERNFVVLVFFMSEVMGVLSLSSRLFQQTGASMIGKDTHRINMLAKFEAMRDDDSTTLLYPLVSKLQCRKEELSGNFIACGTLKKVDEALKVRWVLDSGEHFEFKDKPRAQTISFLTTKRAILDSLISEIQNYFPEGQFSEFDILHPRKFDQSKMLIRDFGEADISTLCERFGIPKAAAVQEWKDLMYIVALHDLHVGYTRASSFWSWALRNSEISFGANVRRLIRTVLAIPPSSADAERAFSTLKYIKSTRRTNLKEQTLQDIMRVTLNGPKDISHFSAARLARDWTGLHTDQPQSGGGRKRKSDGPDTDETGTKKNFTLESDDVEECEVGQAQTEQELVELEFQQNLDAADVVHMLDEPFIENNFAEPHIFA